MPACVPSISTTHCANTTSPEANSYLRWVRHAISQHPKPLRPLAGGQVERHVQVAVSRWAKY